MTSTGFVTHLNRIALLLAAALFIVLGLLWWRERTRHYEAPAWPLESFAVLVAPADAVPAERWIVAVNPGCAQCVARLAELRRRSEAWTADRSLGVLLVDVRRRPDSLVVGDGLDAGVWWDSLGAWRSRWGHRVYGETMVFAPDGALVRVLAPAGPLDPGSP
jgi:hypothetical protein